jgi:hypothetical protein
VWASAVSPVRKRLSFENVLVTLLAFVVLAGGTAFAATHLAKNSVGKKQLKANAVTTAKIKKEAVTHAKIKAGSIDGSKVANGSLPEADLELASLPFGHVVYRARGAASVTLASISEPVVIPLNNPNYIQEAGQDETFTGAVDVNFSSDCEAPRQAIAFALLDDPNPAAPDEQKIIAIGPFSDEGAGAKSVRLSLSTYPGGFRLGPSVATGHSLSLMIIGGCKTGTVTASNGAIDVNGVK